MSEYIRTGLIAVAVVLVIGAGSLYLFVQRRDTVPASVYELHTADSIQRMANVADIYADRNYLDALLPVQVIQQNYTDLADQQPPLSKLLQHSGLVRRLKSCDSAGVLLTNNLVEQSLEEIGQGYEYLGQCLQAISKAKKALDDSEH